MAGHTRFKAAEKLGQKTVPCVIADDLTDEQIRAYRLADNKVAEASSWDMDLLVGELEGITEIDMSEFSFDLDIEGYIDNFFESGIETNTKEDDGTIKIIVKVYEDDSESLEQLLKENGYTYEVKK